MPQLVCEGPCNGSKVRDFEAIVRARGPRITTLSNLTEQELALGRQFKHTPHTFVADGGRGRYACDVCGTQRKYGS